MPFKVQFRRESRTISDALFPYSFDETKREVLDRLEKLDGDIAVIIDQDTGREHLVKRNH